MKTTLIHRTKASALHRLGTTFLFLLGFLLLSHGGMSQGAVVVGAGTLTGLQGDHLWNQGVNVRFSKIVASADTPYFQVVLDLNEVQQLSGLILTNGATATNESIKVMRLSVADENAVGFNPLDAGSYTQVIFDGAVPGTNAGSAVRSIEFNQTTDHRYLLLHVSESFRGVITKGDPMLATVVFHDLQSVVAPIPEPSSAALFLLIGAGGLWKLTRRHR